MSGGDLADRDVDMSAWKPVERAYSFWLRAAREQRGTAVALGRSLERYLRRVYGLAPEADLRALGVETELTGRTISRWEKGTTQKPQPQYPSDRWSREALVAVVTELVPVPPAEMEWASFREVCEAFATDRLERIERGSGSLDSHAAQERDKERHHFLAVWPTAAVMLDPIGLGLGSWAFNGELPPYVNRTTDQELALRLNKPRITTVTGAPKSGKSRSILEVLRSQHPGALTWWVNPSPHVLPLVVEHAKKARGVERPAFIVLDDAGLIGTDPAGGLTAQRINDLSSAGAHLIVVIHDQTIATWERQLTNRTAGEVDTGSLGATRELMNLLVHRIQYTSVLDDNETDPAAQTYEDADERVKSFDLTRLAETLAGVEMLKKQATHLLETPTSVEAALLEAAIDASIAFPSGAFPQTLTALAKMHYRRRQPNRPWRDNLLDDAFDTLTTGITAESPHAILITTNHETYRLLDALAPELQHPHRDIEGNISRLTTSDIEAADLNQAFFETGRWHHLRQYDFGKTPTNIDHATKAKQAWTRAATAGHVPAMLRLGRRNLESWRRDEAESWFHRAVEQGSAEGMVELGELARSSDPELARNWLLRAADKENTSAMVKLGLMSGQSDVKSKWWKRAAELNDELAMHFLGKLLMESGDAHGAERWWRRAAAAGFDASMIALAELAESEASEVEARSWYERAASVTPFPNTDAMVELGFLEYRGGNHEAALRYWTRAVSYFTPGGYVGIGYTACDRSAFDAARLLFEKAADVGTHGDGDWKSSGLRALGDLARDQGELDEAELWYERERECEQRSGISSTPDDTV